MFSFIFIICLINRNHSITYVVKNVKQTINNGDNIDLYSETFRAFGINWYLNVYTTTFTSTGDIKHVRVLLHVEGNFSQE